MLPSQLLLMAGLCTYIVAPRCATACRFVPNQPLPFHQLSPVSDRVLVFSAWQLTSLPACTKAYQGLKVVVHKKQRAPTYSPCFCTPTCQGDVVLLSREGRPQGLGRGAGGKAPASPVDADSAFEAVILDYRWGQGQQDQKQIMCTNS